MLEALGHAAGHAPGVVAVADVRARWIGHRLEAEPNVAVAPPLAVAEGHRSAKCIALTGGGGVLYCSPS